MENDHTPAINHERETNHLMSRKGFLEIVHLDWSASCFGEE